MLGIEEKGENKLDEKSQFKLIQTRFRESLGALKQDHEDWREYDEFYLAKHWNVQRASWLPDPVVNYIAYVVDQKSPQLTNNRPKGLILPTTQGDEPVAKLFTQVTDVIAERVGFDEIISEVVPTGLLLGTAWFKVYWDNNKSGGQYNANDPTRSTVWKGDVCIEAPDPSNIYHDPQAYKVEDCRYIIYAVPKTVEWIKETFKKDVSADNAFETEIYQRPSLDQSKNRVMLYEYWYKENGKINCIYAAGGKILKEIKEVYKHGRYPFVTFIPKIKRKSLTGIGEPKNIMANQKLLNKFLEMLTRNTMLTANPILFVDSKSGIDPNKFQAKPGVVQQVNDLGIQGKKPAEWFQPPQISNDVPLTIEKLIELIERMAGVYDANTGETPGGVTAAAAIQMLVEQGSIPIKGIARNLYAAVKNVYELIIELVKENYTEQRYIRIVDENGGYQFETFIGAQYASIDLDVQVSAEASAPTSPAYIAQMGSDLFDKQLIAGSDYLDMIQGIPNKDKLVEKAREREAQQQQMMDQTAQIEQLMQQNQALQEQVNQLGGDLQTAQSDNSKAQAEAMKQQNEQQKQAHTQQMDKAKIMIDAAKVAQMGQKQLVTSK